MGLQLEGLGTQHQLLERHTPHLRLRVGRERRVRRVEMDAQPWPHAARAAAALLGLRGGDPRVVERGHAARGVVPLFLLPTGVDDQADVGERDRGLRHVGR